MPRGRVITAEIKKKILQLIIVGLTDTEIAAALKISSDVVHKYRKNKEVEKSDGSIKNDKAGHTNNGAAGKRRGRVPDDHQREERRGEPEHHNPDNHTAGETINFTGGKKHTNGEKTDMSNKEEKTEYQYECPACHHQWNGSPAACPKCGKLLQE